MNKMPVSIPGKFLSAYEEFKYSTNYKIKSSSFNLYTIFWAYSIRMHLYNSDCHIAFIKKLLTMLRAHKIHSNFTIIMEEFINTKAIEPFINYTSNSKSEFEIINSLIMLIENYINENEQQLLTNKYYRDYMKGKNLTKSALISCMKSNKFHSLIYYILAIPMEIKLVFRIGSVEHQYPKENKKPIIYLIICDEVVSILLSEKDYNLISKIKLTEPNVDDDESPFKGNKECTGDIDQFSPSKMSCKCESPSLDQTQQNKFVKKFGLKLISTHQNSQDVNFFDNQKNDIIPTFKDNIGPYESPKSKFYPSTINLPTPSNNIFSKNKQSDKAINELSQQSTGLTNIKPYKSADLVKTKTKFISPFSNSSSRNSGNHPCYSTVDIIRETGHKMGFTPKHLEENEDDIEEIAIENSMYIVIKCSICNKDIKSESEYMGNGRIFVCAQCFNKEFAKIAKFNGGNELIFDYGLTLQIVFPKIRKSLFSLLSTILNGIKPQKCNYKNVELKLSDFLFTECPHCYMGWYAHKKLKVDGRVANFICVMCHKLGLYQIKLSCKHLICNQCFNKNKEYCCHFCSKLPQTAIQLIDYSKYDKCSQCNQPSQVTYACEYGHKICYTCNCLSYNYWSKQCYCIVCNSECTVHRLDNMQILKVIT